MGPHDDGRFRQVVVNTGLFGFFLLLTRCKNDKSQNFMAQNEQSCSLIIFVNN